MCKILPLLLTMFLSLFALAQDGSTNTYNVLGPVGGGRNAVPFRAFGIPVEAGHSINWLEVGQNTACYGQPTPYVGFVFLGLPDGSQLSCAPLSEPVFSGTFVGDSRCKSYPTLTTKFSSADANGIPFSGEIVLGLTYYYSRGGGGRGGGGAGCYKIVTGGTLTLTY